MSKPTEYVTTGTGTGDTGEIMWEHVHVSIDESTLSVTCQAGACLAELWETVTGGASWRRVMARGLSAGMSESGTIQVAGSTDGDHRVTITARENGSKVEVEFKSTDYPGGDPTP